MDRRLSAAGVVTLPMSRRDIADYLGFTLETVSKSLSRLQSAEILDFVGNNQREIAILNREKLLSFDLQA